MERAPTTIAGSKRRAVPRRSQSRFDATSGYNRFQPEITILAPTSHSFAYFEEAEPDLDVERWKRLSEAIQYRRKKGVLCSGAPGVR
jgi:hypothetical protein